ncbi:MAG: thioredoxin [Bacilli bacterium]|nr:thioredoxin [Bacilli bacterium]
MSIVHINENEFNEKIKSDLILVDFYADWCGPCKMLGPVLEQIDTVEIVKVNVDENQNLARNLGIMSIPTLMIYNKGVQKATRLGFAPKDELLKWIEENK